MLNGKAITALINTLLNINHDICSVSFMADPSLTEDVAHCIFDFIKKPTANNKSITRFRVIPYLPHSEEVKDILDTGNIIGEMEFLRKKKTG